MFVLVVPSKLIFFCGIENKIAKADIPLFEKHRSFSVTAMGPVLYRAVYFPKLYELNASYLQSSPDGQPVSKWLSSIVDSNAGTAICEHCLLRKKHMLRWPEDAFFQWTIKGGNVLWAWSREHAIALRDHILSKDRRMRTRTFFSLPADFKKKSVRELVCKKINATLESSDVR